MIFVTKINRFSPNANDVRVNYELFADSRDDVTPDAEVYGFPGLVIPAGTRLETGYGEVAHMMSDGTWNWETPGLVPESKLNDLKDVRITNVKSGQVLIRNSNNALWENGDYKVGQYFNVKLSYDYETDTFTVDKTAQEILSAMREGMRFIIDIPTLDYADRDLIVSNAISVDQYAYGVVNYQTGKIPFLFQTHEYDPDNHLVRFFDISVNVPYTEGDVTVEYSAYSISTYQPTALN